MEHNNEQTLRIAGVVKESIVDGPGIRFVVFSQGCPHHCPGCHNAVTHDFEGGYDCSIERILAEIDANPLLDGVTFSGGEPVCQPA
ncbi:MAG: 4Fe-4S cluster-binding domain-containing protein [Emergencia sp.]|nr:4Fe-4S cluster-binding domain-containing protein [Emergencia sp.]